MIKFFKNLLKSKAKKEAEKEAENAKLREFIDRRFEAHKRAYPEDYADMVRAAPHMLKDLGIGV